MSVRVYMLLNTVNGSAEHTVQMLRNHAGVVLADCLEGQPDIIALLEAPNREKLAEAIMPVIGCVDGITEDLRLLVTRDNEIPSAPHTSSSRRLYKRTGEKESTPRQRKQRNNRSKKEIIHA